MQDIFRGNYLRENGNKLKIYRGTALLNYCTNITIEYFITCLTDIIYHQSLLFYSLELFIIFSNSNTSR